ncbi:ATP-binding protein [Halomonas sp. SpR8]|uniref:ATP-binding protein n=1 Tax=Halomonas sp. SpR8 TaxID=3050463 RepID=UPI0027E4E90E|nr:ATP-binding protein [Halomonas sp. SpR8]MDQ7728927.1 ATP-binding protein [Halomonas sp. SpR8]
MNAVYNRSYEIREPIEIRIDGQELVVLSFPGPDRSIRLQDLQAGKAVSRRYRNRRIGEFLKELDLTEGRSTGVPKILRVMKGNGSPEPVFETDDERSYFLIRLPVHRGFLVDKDIAPVATKQVTEQVIRLLQALLEEPMSTKALLEALSLTHRPTLYTKLFTTGTGID